MTYNINTLEAENIEIENSINELNVKLKKINEKLSTLNLKYYMNQRKVHFLKCMDIINRVPNINPNISCITIGSECIETYPCKHTCIVHFMDGTYKKYDTHVSAKYIADTYFDNLDEQHKIHFYRYLDGLQRDKFYKITQISRLSSKKINKHKININ
jgi:hypothetical protein